jgi:hypothetical protein
VRKQRGWPEHSLAAPRVRFIASDTPLAALPGEYRTGELEVTVRPDEIQVVAPPLAVLQIKAPL